MSTVSASFADEQTAERQPLKQMVYVAFGAALDIAKTKEPRTDPAPTNTLWKKKVPEKVKPLAAKAKVQVREAREAKEVKAKQKQN